MSVQTPTLTQALKLAIEAALRRVFVAIPGRIETYDATTRQCTAQPLVQSLFGDESGAANVERLPVVHAPIVFPATARGGLTVPVQAGDTVLLVFCSSSIDQWLALGGEVNPRDTRHHHPSDAIAIPFVFDSQSAPPAPTDAVVLAGDAVKLGDDAATAPVALNTDLAALVGIISGWTPSPGDGGAALKTALTAYISSHAGFPVGSTKVKAT